MRVAALAALLAASLTSASVESGGVRRLFAPDSFWNQKIAPDAPTDPDSARWIALLQQEPSCHGFGINVNRYTIPLYVVNASTPRQVIAEAHGPGKPTGPYGERFRQSEAFRGTLVPIPPDLRPSPGTDAHVAIVDYGAGRMWDMWGVSKAPDGGWQSNTGMIVDVDGPGVFPLGAFGAKLDDSIHQYGPSRAAGVPAAAGLIRYDEVKAGHIDHKLAAAVRFVAYHEFVYPPAIWTDGNLPGGLPEGAVLQLDPKLDLMRLGLTPEERVVARALQDYGMVITDFAEASVLYAEGTWYDPKRSWQGKLREFDGGIANIPLTHFRVIATGPRQVGGGKLKSFFQNALKAPSQCQRRG